LHTTISTSRDHLYFAAADRAGGLKALLSTSKWGAARLFVRLFIAALLYVPEVLVEDVGRFLFEARDGPDWSWRDSKLLRLDTGAPSGYLDPYLQVFSDKNPYLDLQGSFPTVHLDPQVFYLQVTGQQVLKVPTGIQ
jgi:hypothetical protein